MAEIINLRARRKAAERSASKAQAAANAEKFGRTKGQKALEAAETAKAKQELDGKKRDEDGGT